MHVTAVLSALCLAVAVMVGRTSPVRDRVHRVRSGPPARPVGVRPAGPRCPPVPVPVLLDLVAEVLSGGAAPASALTAVADALRLVGDPQAGDLARLAARVTRGDGTGAAAGVPAPVCRLAEALDLAVATGSSPVGLIRAAARQERLDRASRQVRAARRLSVLVLLPTGLCLLPAFVLLTVVPLAISLALE